jgi:hypothetical protein
MWVLLLRILLAINSKCSAISQANVDEKKERSVVSLQDGVGFFFLRADG